MTAEQAPHAGTGSRIDPYGEQYARRARGIVASGIRALFAGDGHEPERGRRNLLGALEISSQTWLTHVAVTDDGGYDSKELWQR